jgi:ABC-type Fe3+/spermidine/putrescine transport system ATPase subunit
VSGNATQGVRDADTAPLLRIEGVSKRFGDFAAVDGVTLSINRGESLALLGGSGSGKSTLLRMLAGLLEPDAGRIVLDEQDMAGVPPHARPVNMMFQSYALFPHMSVAQNIAFGLRMESAPKALIRDRVADMLALVRMEGFGDRKPVALSGGQRARIALARARRSTRSCCCSTSRSRRSTRTCARPCSSSSAPSRRAAAPPSSSSPMTRRRR